MFNSKGNEAGGSGSRGGQRDLKKKKSIKELFQRIKKTPTGFVEEEDLRMIFELNGRCINTNDDSSTGLSTRQFLECHAAATAASSAPARQYAFWGSPSVSCVKL